MSEPSYEQLRTGFTAAVSHELRTPLARILALLDNATLPGADTQALIDQARDEVAASFADAAARAGVTIAVTGETELPLRPRMLRIVAENLVENAIRYAGHGAAFHLVAGSDAGGTFLSGADDGAGVFEADLPRLFERFWRADAARASRGTGLGLAIVKHVVTAAGGTVEAHGARGRGLEVRCSFSTSS